MNSDTQRTSTEEELRTWFATHEPLRSAQTVTFDRERFYRATLLKPERPSKGSLIWWGTAVGFAVALSVMGSFLRQQQSTATPQKAAIHRPSAHHQPPSAQVQRDRLLGLPVPPRASAPLAQREHWIIVQSAPYGQEHHILKEWNALGQPPLYWSPFSKAYYFWVNQSADQAVTLLYTYALNDPRWYGQPLSP